MTDEPKKTCHPEFGCSCTELEAVVLKLQPGDVLIVRISAYWTPGQANRLHRDLSEVLQRAGIDNEVVIMQHESLQVVRAEEVPA